MKRAHWGWRLALVFGIGLLASGCSSGARPGAMSVDLMPDKIIDASSPLHSAFEIGKISGGSETNPLWKSKVSDADFRQALMQSLNLQTMLATADPRFTIDAQLVELDQPSIGFDLTVTAKVHYTITSKADHSVKLDETLVTPYTANLSDAFVAVERLRLANEGAMRENIKSLIGKLFEESRPGRPLSL